MLNAIIEAMMISEISKALMPSRPSYEAYDPYAEENARLQAQLERQEEKIERLENALVQVGTAVAQTGAVLAGQGCAKAALPAGSDESPAAGFSRGQVYAGRVNKIHRGGANVTIGDYFGFLPKGQISYEWVNDVSDVLEVGQAVNVKVIKVIPEKNLVIVSMKQA